MQARFQAAQRARARGERGRAGPALALRRRALTAADRRALATAAAANAAALRAAPRDPPGRQPVTLGLAEPFTQTLTVAGYFALLFALPIILFQAYAFLLPAFSPRDRRVALPLMAMVPVLFVIGVVFAYLLVLPAAVGFLQNFNQGQFDALVQARPYYGFTIATLAAMGVLFQIPVGILALTRLGVITPRQLRKNRRYAIVVIAIVAALLPGVDPVTTLIEMIPMLFLYEFGILLSAWTTRLSRTTALPPQKPAANPSLREVRSADQRRRRRRRIAWPPPKPGGPGSSTGSSPARASSSARVPQPASSRTRVALDAEARPVERRLRIEAVVDDARTTNCTCAWAWMKPPMIPNGPSSAAVAQQHAGDDRVVRAAARARRAPPTAKQAPRFCSTTPVPGATMPEPKP